DSRPKYATPVFLSADVRRKAEALDRYTLVTLLKLRFSLTDCDFYVCILIAIMTKPKPVTPESPSQTPQGSEPQPQGARMTTPTTMLMRVLQLEVKYHQLSQWKQTSPEPHQLCN
ncbi:unnamed protein product, partial [Ilex paraguariensis]